MEEVVRAPIYTAQYNADRFGWIKDMGVDVVPTWLSNMPLSKTKHYVYAPILADVYKHIDLTSYDLVLGASHTFAHGVKVRPDTIFSILYHTPARSLWAPEIDPRAGKGVLREAIVRRLKRLDLNASHNPTYLMANSFTIKERVERVYRRPVDEVLYPGVNIEKFSSVQRVSEEAGYLVYGRQIAYKRTDLAILAAKRMGFKLQVVGAGPMLSQWTELAAGDPNIIFHGRLPDADLLELMGRCRGFLFPAYEDFGIVVVEAMAAGLPVIGLAQGGASETVKPGAGVAMQDQTVDALCNAIRELEKSPLDTQYIKRCAEPFSIARFKEQFTQSIVNAIAAGPNRPYL
jgi:glycosyltransferase involved in cell wall biosynthesis